MTSTTNTTQKNLIKILTQTHNNPQKAYKQALQQATTQQEREQVEKIAQKFNIIL